MQIWLIQVDWCELIVYHNAHVILTIPETNSSQPSIFRGYVSFSEGNTRRHLRTSTGAFRMGKDTVVECYINNNSLLAREKIHPIPHSNFHFDRLPRKGTSSNSSYILVNLQFLHKYQKGWALNIFRYSLLQVVKRRLAFSIDGVVEVATTLPWHCQKTVMRIFFGAASLIIGPFPQIWAFSEIGVLQNAWFIMENPIKMDDLGAPLFSETSISRERNLRSNPNLPTKMGKRWPYFRAAWELPPILPNPWN